MIIGTGAQPATIAPVPGSAGSMAARGRTYYGIELLRFVTAVAVLVFHYQHFYVGGPTGFDVVRQPFYAALWPMYRYGYCGVQVFWCISGFIFFARYGGPVRSGDESVRDFAVARFSRLYPLHWLTLFAVAAMQWVYIGRHGVGFVYPNNDLANFLGQLGMASSWQTGSGPGTYSFNGPIWSVSLEIAAYVVFFAVTRCFGASIMTVIGTLVAVVALDAGVGHHPVFSCIVYFYIGAAVFRLVDAMRTPGPRRLAMGTALVAACGAGVLCHLGKVPVAVATLVMAPSALLVAALCFERAGERLGHGATLLGNTTYASYLLHFPVQLLCVLVLEAVGIDIPVASHAFFLAFIVGTFLLAVGCHRWIEWPAQQWLRRRLGRRRRSASPGARAAAPP